MYVCQELNELKGYEGEGVRAGLAGEKSLLRFCTAGK